MMCFFKTHFLAICFKYIYYRLYLKSRACTIYKIQLATQVM